MAVHPKNNVDHMFPVDSQYNPEGHKIEIQLTIDNHLLLFYFANQLSYF